MRQKALAFVLAATLATSFPSLGANVREDHDRIVREPIVRRVVRVVRGFIGAVSNGDGLQPPLPRPCCP